MVFTYENDALTEIKAGNYVAAISLLKKEWNQSPDNLSLLVTYGCALWYVVNYDVAGSLQGSAQQNDRLNTYVDELHKLHSILIAMPNVPAELRAVWGWLVSIMPYYFQSGNLAALGYFGPGKTSSTGIQYCTLPALQCG